MCAYITVLLFLEAFGYHDVKLRTLMRSFCPLSLSRNFLERSRFCMFTCRPTIQSPGTTSLMKRVSLRVCDVLFGRADDPNRSVTQKPQ